MRDFLIICAWLFGGWAVLSPIALWLFKRTENKPYSKFEDVLLAIAFPSAVVVCIYYFITKKSKGQDIISW